MYILIKMVYWLCRGDFRIGICDANQSDKQTGIYSLLFSCWENIQLPTVKTTGAIGRLYNYQKKRLSSIFQLQTVKLGVEGAFNWHIWIVSQGISFNMSHDQIFYFYIYISIGWQYPPSPQYLNIKLRTSVHTKIQLAMIFGVDTLSQKNNHQKYNFRLLTVK